MSIKVKLGNVFTAVKSGALDALENVPGLTTKGTYDAIKLRRLAAPELQVVESASNKLVEELGEVDEDGKKGIKPGTPAMQQYLVKFNELLSSQDVELAVSPVKLPAWKDDDPCPLTAGQLRVLAPFIVPIPGVTDAAEEAKDGDAKKLEKGTDA